MATLRCRRFPRGTVHIRTAGGVVVDFHDGTAEVGDPELVEALLAVPPVFGIEADEPQAPQAVEVPESDRPPPPKRGPGSGADAWTAYGRDCGVDVPDGMKASAIRDLLADCGIRTE